MALPAGLTRSTALLKMKQAYKAGVSGAAALRQLTSAGLSYRRQTMLADWRSVADVEKKTGLLKYVRKDYYPSPQTVASVSWQLSREFLYKVKVQTRLKPGEPLTERFVNIVTDRPMTPREIETEVRESWGSWYAERKEQIETVTPDTAVHRVS